MTALLGINVAPTADPIALRAASAWWVRCVYRESGTTEYPEIRPWALELQRQRIELVMVGDSSPNSLGKDKTRWYRRMSEARDRLGDIVTWWQWFNEPDGDGMASWTMSHEQVNAGLEMARTVFPRDSGWRLLAPGLVSGDTNWPWGLRLDLCDGLDAHPYSKYLYTPEQERELREMIERYADVARYYGIELWLGEYDSRTAGLSTYFRDFPGVSRAAVMAWDNQMTDGEGLALGLLQNPTAMADFISAARRDPVVVAETPRFVLGFKDFHDAFPDLVGDPIPEDPVERGGVPGLSFQETSRGFLTAAHLADPASMKVLGWRITFFERPTRHRYLFERGRLEQIA